MGFGPLRPISGRSCFAKNGLFRGRGKKRRPVGPTGGPVVFSKVKVLRSGTLLSNSVLRSHRSSCGDPKCRAAHRITEFGSEFHTKARLSAGRSQGEPSLDVRSTASHLRENHHQTVVIRGFQGLSMVRDGAGDAPAGEEVEQVSFTSLLAAISCHLQPTSFLLLVALASTPVVMASIAGLHPSSDGLQPSSDGLYENKHIPHAVFCFFPCFWRRF